MISVLKTLFLIGLLALVTACSILGGAKPSDRLVGTWAYSTRSYDEAEVSTRAIRLAEDGLAYEGDFRDDRFGGNQAARWSSVDEGHLVFVENGGAVQNMGFAFDGPHELRILKGDGTVKYWCIRR